MIGINSYTLGVQYNNTRKNVRFGASAEAVRMFRELQNYQPSNLYKFTSTEINALARKNRKGAPKVYKELAGLAKNSNHWAASFLEKIAEAASKW